MCYNKVLEVHYGAVLETEVSTDETWKQRHLCKAWSVRDISEGALQCTALHCAALWMDVRISEVLLENALHFGVGFCLLPRYQRIHVLVPPRQHFFALQVKQRARIRIHHHHDHDTSGKLLKPLCNIPHDLLTDVQARPHVGGV